MVAIRELALNIYLLGGVTDFDGILIVRNQQLAISMGFRAGLAGGQFTFLSRLSAAGGTAGGQDLFFGGFHGSILGVCAGRSWSILTNGKHFSEQRRRFSMIGQVPNHKDLVNAAMGLRPKAITRLIVTDPTLASKRLGILQSPLSQRDWFTA